MIFVTVGMHTVGFDRLIRKMDEIAGKIDEEVIIQIGTSSYKPRNAKFFNFLDEQKMKYYYERSRLIVSHAGAGTIIMALSAKKPIILVPRKKEFLECIDDQQLDLSEKLSQTEGIITIYDVNEIERFLEDPIIQNKSNRDVNKSLINYLKGVVNE